MTIWSVAMAVTGMTILLLTNLSSQEGPALRSMAEPGRETNDGAGQVSDSIDPEINLGASPTVAGTAPDFDRLPC
jgi:hypothetical protein